MEDFKIQDTSGNILEISKNATGLELFVGDSFGAATSVQLDELQTYELCYQLVKVWK